MEHTIVSSVQTAGPRHTWPAGHVYVGMPGPASRGAGIPDAEARFGKPWATKSDPRGWPVAYIEYLVRRMANDPAFEQAVAGLHGKVLLCWCTAKAERRGTEVLCHARILTEFVELLFHAAVDDDQRRVDEEVLALTV